MDLTLCGLGWLVWFGLVQAFSVEQESSREAARKKAWVSSFARQAARLMKQDVVRENKEQKYQLRQQALRANNTAFMVNSFTLGFH